MTQETATPPGPARLFGPDMLANPYPVYHHLRSTDPVHWHEPLQVWVLTRHADVTAMLLNPHGSSDRTRSAQAQAPPELQELFSFRSNAMHNADPPRHTRLRGLVSKAFTPAAVERLAPFIQKEVDAAVDAALARGGMEIVNDLAYPLPVTVIAHLMGVPREDRDQIKRWCDDITATLGNVMANLRPEDFHQANQSTRELNAYFRRVIAEGRGRARDDLLTAMAMAEEQGVRLSEAELFANAVLLLNAGHETTTNLIGNGSWALLRFPDQRRRLGQDPSLAQTAIEEFLRFESPVQFTPRLLKADATMGGKTLRRGSWCWRCWGRPTATRPASPTPTGWTWAGRTTSTWRSAWVRTSVWGRRWPGWRAGSCCKRCCDGCPVSAWTGRNRSTATTSICAASRR